MLDTGSLMLDKKEKIGILIQHPASDNKKQQF
jgi:hypothetical protein